MAQVGRISGPLLTANLERNGIDLAFRNTLDQTQLLYIDVNTGKIGINRNAPLVELNIEGDSRSTNYISTTSSNIANFTVSNNNIDINSGNIFLNASSAIVLSNLETAQFYATDNTIGTNSGDTNMQFVPNGTGTVESFGNVNVTGNIHATGNITADGSLTFGDGAEDNVVFNADVNSSLIPDTTNTYSLGSPTKRWSTLVSGLLNGTNVVSGTIDVSSIAPLNRKQGNIFWVAQNGDDTNVGDHPNGPFKTLKRALDAADASTGGPITIHVMPGGYEEQTPLVVPSNVTIKGEDFRNTIIRPESAYQSEDVFHLNGETTISNITIKDFYYDSLNDTGYAFRFAPNTVISSRSPYIQNVTVITQGTTTSASDPRGFASGDAGKGALIDGADVLSASNEASMLFHSATFITPGVDAITMTNGVRVEWLNSFTYFANRGLYAKNGATGHLSTDGSTIQYGAEIRSIGSASVYGNIGSEADGDDCIMYLIAHNFAYIGAGKFVDNDPSRVIQSQETIELNSGKIYHVSQDHGGDFRIGDQFFIDFDTGQTSLELSAAEFNNLASLTITSDGGETIIRPTLIDVGNFRFSGNTIESLVGAINLDSHTTNNIVFNNDMSFKKNLTMTGNLSIGRELITFGDTFGVDTIDFNADINSDVLPGQTGYYNIGSDNLRWFEGYFSEANIGDVRFVDTTITTNISNSNLEIHANGTGRVYIPNNDVQIDVNASVVGTTSIKNTNITGNVTLAGDYSISDDFTVDGNLVIGQNLQINKAELEKINITGNLIETQSNNDDLDIRASGTGNIQILTNLNIDNDITVLGTTNSGDLNLQNTSADFDTGNLKIYDNVIETVDSNSNIELRYAGTGNVTFDDIKIKENILFSDTNDIVLDVTQDLTINGTGALLLPRGTSAERSQNQGDIRFNTTSNVFELYVNSSVALGGVYSDDLKTNVIAHPTNDTLLLRVNNALLGSFDSDGVNLHSLQVEDINLDSNTIQTNVSNSNLELRPDGNGDVVIEGITISGNSILNTVPDEVLLLSNSDDGYWQFAGPGAIIMPPGTQLERPSSPEIGFTRINTDSGEMESWTGTAWITSAGEFENVSIADMEDESLIQSLIYG